MDFIKARIRDIPDFPEPGIIFKDLTPLLADASALRQTIEALVQPFENDRISAVVGMEARGFIFGSLAAQALNCAFVPLRKPGKLPGATHRVSYDLEYGSAELHIHQDALSATDRVLLVDDLIATGGTAAASEELVSLAQAKLIGAAFVIELDFLSGREALTTERVHTLVNY